jgi:hypothetical protein
MSCSQCYRERAQGGGGPTDAADISTALVAVTASRRDLSWTAHVGQAARSQGRSTSGCQAPSGSSDRVGEEGLLGARSPGAFCPARLSRDGWCTAGCRRLLDRRQGQQRSALCFGHPGQARDVQALIAAIAPQRAQMGAAPPPRTAGRCRPRRRWPRAARPPRAPRPRPGRCALAPPAGACGLPPATGAPRPSASRPPQRRHRRSARPPLGRRTPRPAPPRPGGRPPGWCPARPPATDRPARGPAARRPSPAGRPAAAAAGSPRCLAHSPAPPGRPTRSVKQRQQPRLRSCEPRLGRRVVEAVPGADG